MNDLQRKLWLAWHKASQTTAQMIRDRPESNPSDPENAMRQFDWQACFNEACGVEQGLRKACVIAEVPHFEE